VITTRNVTFNKELFYSRDKLDAIPALEATAVIKILYKTSEIVHAGDAIELPITEREDLSLASPAE